MKLELQISSFLFGLVIGLALMLVLGQAYAFLFGSRRLRELSGEVSNLRRAVAEKDRYIRKSLEALKREGLEPPLPPAEPAAPDSRSAHRSKS